MREFALVQLKLSSPNGSLSIPPGPIAPFAKPASKQKVEVGAQSGQALTIPVAHGTGPRWLLEERWPLGWMAARAPTRRARLCALLSGTAAKMARRTAIAAHAAV